MFTNGTLTINELERVTDEGVYTCIARNTQDIRSIAKTSFTLKVFGKFRFSISSSTSLQLAIILIQFKKRPLD